MKHPHTNHTPYKLRNITAITIGLSLSYSLISSQTLCCKPVKYNFIHNTFDTAMYSPLLHACYN